MLSDDHKYSRQTWRWREEGAAAAGRHKVQTRRRTKTDIGQRAEQSCHSLDERDLTAADAQDTARIGLALDLMGQ